MVAESITDPSRARLRLVVTGGGTGGHVSPIVATIERMRELIDLDVHWIGSRMGPERAAAARLHAIFHQVTTGKLRRYASLATIADCFRVPLGIIQSLRLLRRIRPSVIFSSGGFVGVPAVVAARMLGISSITHEQTASLGLATQINSRFSDVIALSFVEADRRTQIGRSRVVVTGNPVRSIVMHGDAARARGKFGLSGSAATIYVTGGAQGAQAINKLVGQSLSHLLQRAEIIHQCGPRTGNGDFDRLVALKDRLPADLAPRYTVIESVGDEIGDVYAAADLVICRAGAGTVSELAAVGVPSILIPLPGAKEQLLNARLLADVGAAVVLDQAPLEPDLLVRQIFDLIDDEPLRARMAAAARTIAPINAADRLVDEIIKLSGMSH